jgi:hypothetical protein
LLKTEWRTIRATEPLEGRISKVEEGRLVINVMKISLMSRIIGDALAFRHTPFELKKAREAVSLAFVESRLNATDDSPASQQELRDIGSQAKEQEMLDYNGRAIELAYGGFGARSRDSKRSIRRNTSWDSGFLGQYHGASSTNPASPPASMRSNLQGHTMTRAVDRDGAQSSNSRVWQEGWTNSTSNIPPDGLLDVASTASTSRYRPTSPISSTSSKQKNMNFRAQPSPSAFAASDILQSRMKHPPSTGQSDTNSTYGFHPDDLCDIPPTTTAPEQKDRNLYNPNSPNVLTGPDVPRTRINRRPSSEHQSVHSVADPSFQPQSIGDQDDAGLIDRRQAVSQPTLAITIPESRIEPTTMPVIPEFETLGDDFAYMMSAITVPGA